jgi:hypothetical protein
MAVSFICGGNWSTRKKPTDLSQVTDKLVLFSTYPKVFIAIFGQTMLKLDPCPV